MDTEKILALVDGGTVDRRLAVFRFRRATVKLQAIAMGALAVAILVVATALRPYVVGGGWGPWGAAAVAGLMFSWAAWSLLRALRDLRHAGTNVLVVTRDEVLRRLGGQVQTWSFDEHPGLNVVLRGRRGAAHQQIDLKRRKIDKDLQKSNYGGGAVNAVYLNQEGHTFQKLLVSDNRFGPMCEIVRAIAERRES
jgi:hypothetical protein